MKKILVLLAALILIVAVAKSLNVLPSSVQKLIPNPSQKPLEKILNQPVVQEESTITQVVEKSLPSVVTVGVSTTESSAGGIEVNPFDPFSPFQQVPGTNQKVEKNIG